MTRVTVLTGAGISTDSGIPDFRGPKGVWTRDPAAEALFTIDNYVADPEIRRRSWLSRRENPLWNAEPNAGHRALVDLEAAGLLHRLVTQNIDRLHQRAGSDPDRVIEIHGNMVETRCMGCGVRGLTDEVLDRIDAGDDDPHCEGCGALIKTATIMFGEMLDPDVLDASVEAAATCDLFLAVGTSLGVHPAAGLVDIAAGAGAEIIIVNAEPTPYDRIATRVIDEPIAESLPALVSELVARGDTDTGQHEEWST